MHALGEREFEVAVHADAHQVFAKCDGGVSRTLAGSLFCHRPVYVLGRWHQSCAAPGARLRGAAGGSTAAAVGYVSRAMSEPDLREILKRRDVALQRRDETIVRLREELRRTRTAAEPFPAEGVVWIFGSARTGSTWLGKMLGDLAGVGWWSEPAIGAMVGEFYFERFPQRRGRQLIFANSYRDVWLSGIRSLVLDGAAARSTTPAL